MNTEILSATTPGIQITEFLLPYAVALVALVASLWFRDFATKIAKGLAFQMNKAFQEGDKVILDGEKALIVKIGITHTVFGISKTTGDYCWRFVPNERIPYLKLEKLIFDVAPLAADKKINENTQAAQETTSKKT